MRSTLQLTLVIGIGLLGASDVVSAQAHVAGAIQKAPPKHFHKTDQGDWQTTVTPPGGAPFVYTFVPGTKIEPSIDVKVERLPGDARFLYTYSLRNGVNARQDFATLFLNITNPVAVRSLPQNWVNERKPGEGSLVLRGPLGANGVASGVAPGSTMDGLVIEAPVLPGVTTLRARGNTKGDVDLPQGLSDAQYQELVDLSRQTTVQTPTIAPAIGLGVGEPELQLDVLLARIGSHYVSAFNVQQHPQAQALEQAFSAVYAAGGNLKSPALQAALERVLEISQATTANPWHQQMSAALQVCLRAVLDGVVPNRRPVDPADFVGR